MPDSRFFKKAGPFTLKQLAEIGGCELLKPEDADIQIENVNSLRAAGQTDISFLLSRKYLDDLKKTNAGASIVHPDFAASAPEKTAVLLSKEPYRSYGLIAAAFYPAPKAEKTIVHPKAVIASTAVIGEGSRIDAGAVIGENVTLGKNCHICPNAVIGDNVVMGDDCIVGENASVLYTLAGNQVYIYPGARIGQDGFGFFMSPKGHTKIPQLGRVIIGNDVEIGANTTIDRGALDDTIVGDGARLDNLVQFGHNVQTGKCCVVVSQAGIAGSTHLGDFVVLAGQVGVAGHLNIGSGAQIAGQSGVMRDVEPMESLMGTPAVPIKDFMRQAATLKKLIKR
ncbi:MAG: UDP-3-O-(3-hydroxymyristoyl)glucosamine N-acyltransferase [Alphaproteobacteria bacterium]|nr:UDP-3-O-(3-hydroxymyristoyl)glucosamine N-acyltransferase [Alphaproteobacteria bacterium]